MKTRKTEFPSHLKMIFCGFPGRAARGYLGWSSVVLIDLDEKILIDTGDWGCRQELINKLAILGLKPRDISKLVLTHLHYDHIANLTIFENAKIAVCEKAMEYADKNTSDCFVPPFIADHLHSIRERLILVKDGVMIHDKIQILATPGHTPDSISCLYEDEGTRTIVTGDAIKNAHEYVTETFDETRDVVTSKQTMNKIRMMADVIIPGHDRPFYVKDGKIFYLYKTEDTLLIKTNPFSKEWTTLTIATR